MLRFITYFVFILINGTHCWAGAVLTENTTFRRNGMEIDLTETNSVLIGSASDKAEEIFSFFEKNITPVVPENFRNKIAKRLVRIEFQKKLEKGAKFIDSSDESAPLVLKVRAEIVNDPSFYRLLAHEWFHALHFVVHRDEPAWVREGLAQVFETMVLGGYNGSAYLFSVLENSTTPLEAAFDVRKENLEEYGHVFLYFYYLYQKCGNQALFWKIVEGTGGKFGAETIESALSQMPPVTDQPAYCMHFKESVINAELSRLINHKAQLDGKTTDEFFIIPDLNRTFKNVLTEKAVAATLTNLELFEPKLFQAGAQKTLRKYSNNEAWTIFTIQQGFPRNVRPGLSVDQKAIPPDLVFVMKTK